MKAVALAIIVALVGCGLSQREIAIRDTLITANVAEQAFVTLDRDVQAKLVVSATDYASGEQSLKDWREKRGKAEEAIIGLYRAIAIAATFKDDGPTFQTMLNTLALVKQQLTSMGVSL